MNDLRFNISIHTFLTDFTPPETHLPRMCRGREARQIICGVKIIWESVTGLRIRTSVLFIFQLQIVSLNRLGVDSDVLLAHITRGLAAHLALARQQPGRFPDVPTNGPQSLINFICGLVS